MFERLDWRPSEPAAPTIGNTEALSAVEFRRAAIGNCYCIVRVRTGGKAPIAQGWENGEALGALESVSPDALNSGLILRGLRAIDVDVDDGTKAREVEESARSLLPDLALIRRRNNSPRFAMLFRAEEGEPRKRVQEGSAGRVEALGFGQQLVVDGVHTTGARLMWDEGRSPASVPRDRLPTVSEAAVDAFLARCAQILEPPICGVRQQFHPTGVFGDMTVGLSSPAWFAHENPEDQRSIVRACLTAIDTSQSDPREQWLRVLFGAADAEHQGCPDARALALEWSRRGAGWTNESDFERAWQSFVPDRGITIGSLISMARERGADLSPWRSTLSSARNATVEEMARHHSAVALRVSDLPQLPAKRKWLHGTDLVRGAVSMLVAPGARGKSTLLMGLALACASGRDILGRKVFGGPLRVLYINAEDPAEELGRRLRAAMFHYGLADDELEGLRLLGADGMHLGLLTPDKSGPVLNDKSWNDLETQLEACTPDVLIIDPLVSIVGGVTLNDNAAAALLMARFVQIAARRRMAVMLAHHAAKFREAGSAESAMGAASLVNLARICLAIEPLAEKDAPRIGAATWEARSFFRLVGTKQNLSAPKAEDRWFRLSSVTLPNAEPPIYDRGDEVAVVAPYTPSLSAASPYSEEVIQAALNAIAGAPQPLSPGRRNTTDIRAGLVIARAIAPHRNGAPSEAEVEALIAHLQWTGLIAIEDVRVPRVGRSAYTRKGIIVTQQRKRENASADFTSATNANERQSCSLADDGVGRASATTNKGV